MSCPNDTQLRMTQWLRAQFRVCNDFSQVLAFAHSLPVLSIIPTTAGLP